jgi:hypothetical protein
MEVAEGGGKELVCMPNISRIETAGGIKMHK